MDLSSELVPIISKQSIEKHATDFLKRYCPEALEIPMAVPIDDIAEIHMGLEVDYVNITRDCDILGMMIFSDTYVELYDKEKERNIQRFYEKGSLLVEEALEEGKNRGRQRFTIAHEVVHWDLHQLRFMVLSYQCDNSVNAFRCPAEKVYMPRSAEEWIEWQADSMAAAVLMPKNMFIQETTKNIEKVATLYGFQGKLLKDCVIDRLADIFQVSRQAARIRFDSLELSVNM